MTRAQTLVQTDSVDGQICTLQASQDCPDSKSTHSFYRHNECYTNIAAEMSTALFCLVKSPTQTDTINANNEEKGYRSTHTQRRHPMGVLVSFTAPGKPPLRAEACLYPEPILTLWCTEKFSYPHRGSNPEHSVVQSLGLKWSIWYRKVTHWCEKWVI